jgi:hypothetical protein
MIEQRFIMSRTFWLRVFLNRRMTLWKRLCDRILIPLVLPNKELTTMAKFEAGDRVRIIRILNALATKVNEEGTITDLNSMGYTVEFDDSGVLSGLVEDDLELVETEA